MNWQWTIVTMFLVAISSYFWGNINWAVVISKLKGRDIRTIGSGNPGTMNMLRNFGIPIGAVTLVMDVVKGILPCIIGWLLLGNNQFLRLGSDRIGLYIAAIATVLGHVYPLLMRFKGGKGVATIIGICLTAQPIVTLICFAIGVAFLFITEIGSLTSFIIIFIPLAFEGVLAAQSPHPIAAPILVFALFLLTLVAHRSNIVKLFSGTEGRVVLIHRKDKKDKPKIEGDENG